MKAPQIILLAAIVSAFLIGGVSNLNRHTDPKETDTDWYLENALEIRENGGLIHFIPRCLTGKYKEANQHPLYLLLLSTRVRREIGFFVEAKFVSLLSGLALLLSLFFVAGRLFSIPTALVTITLLAFNAGFLELTSMVACESTLTVFFVWAWYFISRQPQTWWRLSAAGCAAGLAYLTKANGLLLVVGYGISILPALRADARKVICGALLFVASFTVVSAPLLIRNQINHGNPLYNLNSSRVMWLDSWEEIFKPENLDFRMEHVGPAYYFEKHSVADAATRLLSGAGAQIESFGELNRLTVGGRFRSFVFASLLLFSLIGVITDRRKALFPLATTILFFSLLSWYAPIGAAHRYWFPVLPFFLTYSSQGMTLAGTRLSREIAIPRRSLVGLALLAALASVALAWRHGDFSDPRNSYVFSSGHEQLIQWLEQRSGAERVLIGPTQDYPAFYSEVELDRLGVFPLVDDLSQFEAYLAANSIDYLVVNPDMIRGRPFLQEFFAAEARRGVIVKRLPAGWKVVFRDPSSAPNYVVVGYATPISSSKLRE